MAHVEFDCDTPACLNHIREQVDATNEELHETTCTGCGAEFVVAATVYRVAEGKTHPLGLLHSHKEGAHSHKHDPDHPSVGHAEDEKKVPKFQEVTHAGAEGDSSEPHDGEASAE